MNHTPPKIVGYRDMEGWVWENIEDAKDFFDGRYFTLIPVYEDEPEKLLEFNKGSKLK